MVLPHDDFLSFEYIYLEYLFLIYFLVGGGGTYVFATFLVNYLSKRFKKKRFGMLIKFTALVTFLQDTILRSRIDKQAFYFCLKIT